VPRVSFPVAMLRRYPVKGMGGESLSTLRLDRRGVTGDRWYAVEDGDGRFASGRDGQRTVHRAAVFAYAARTDAGRVLVTGGEGSWRVGDPGLDAELSAAMGTAVTVRAEGEVPHLEAGQVSLVGTASLEWCRHHLGVDADPRRLRPNIVLRTSVPFVEETWVGMVLTLGSTELRVAERIERCPTVDLAQDGVTTTTPFLRALAEERDLCLGVYAMVEHPGEVALGDETSVRRTLRRD